MEGKVRISIGVSIPASMKNEEIFNILEEGMDHVREVLEKSGIFVDDYKIKLTVG